jgi:hypothetical protein
MQIIPFAGFATSQAANRRVGAIRRNQQGRTQLAAVDQRQLPTVRGARQLLDARVADQLQSAAALHRVQQRILHHTVFDDMPEHFGMYGLGGKMNLPGARAVPYVHVGVGARAARGDARPGTDPLQDALAGCGQRTDPRFEAALRVEVDDLERARIEHDDLQPATFEGECQGTADHAGTHDDQIRLHHFSPGCRARGLSRM